MCYESKICSFINYLNKINANTNIFYELCEGEDFPLGDYVAEYIIHNERELNNYLNPRNNFKLEEFASDVVEYSTEKTIEAIIGLNQYVQIDALLTNKLHLLYEDFIVKIIKMLYLNGSINSDYIHRIVIEHQLKLRNILGTIDELRIFPKDERFIAPIPCSEYSAEIQLEILNINIEEIKEPILDFGCGSNANLVHYLRELGLEAYGIDRTVRNKLFTIQENWFEYEFKPNYWGTIISHLSFTNHFKRNHFKKNGNHITYARKYMELLDSLKPGGEFYYTPDLPFIEQFLSPDLYIINKKVANNSHKILGNKEPLDIQSIKIEKVNN